MNHKEHREDEIGPEKGEDPHGVNKSPQRRESNEILSTNIQPNGSGAGSNGSIS
jgi:hypothetical protein